MNGYYEPDYTHPLKNDQLFIFTWHRYANVVEIQQVYTLELYKIYKFYLDIFAFSVKVMKNYHMANERT